MAKIRRLHPRKRRKKTSYTRKGKRFLNKKRVTRGYRMKHGYEVVKRRRKSQKQDATWAAVAAIGAVALAL